MSDDDVLKRYEQLTHKVKSLQEKAAEATARKKLLLERAQSEFGCGTLEALQAKHAELTSKEAELSAQLVKELDAFEETWGDRLEGRPQNPLATK